MDKQQLGWAVLLVVRRLFDANHRQIPDVHAAVPACARKDRRAVRRPRKVEHLVRVRLEGVQPLRGRAQVVQDDCFVGGAGEEEVF